MMLTRPPLNYVPMRDDQADMYLDFGMHPADIIVHELLARLANPHS